MSEVINQIYKNPLGKVYEISEDGNSYRIMTVPPLVVDALIEIGKITASMLLKQGDERKTLEWQEETSRKLDIIVSNTYEILNDLKKLRLYIDASLEKNFRAAVENRLKSYIQTFDDIVKNKKYEKITIAERERIYDLSSKVHETTYELISYGFAGITAVASSTYSYIAMQSYLGKTDSDIITIKNFLQNIINWFDNAGDPSFPGSFAYIRNTVEKEANNAKGEIDNFPKLGLLGYDEYRFVDQDDPTCRHCITAASRIYYYYDVYEGNVIGDINTGFNISNNKLDDVNSSNPNGLPDFPHFPHHVQLDSTKKYSEYASIIGAWLSQQAAIYRENTATANQLNGYSEFSLKIANDLKDLVSKL